MVRTYATALFHYRFVFAGFGLEGAAMLGVVIGKGFLLPLDFTLFILDTAVILHKNGGWGIFIPASTSETSIPATVEAAEAVLV